MHQRTRKRRRFVVGMLVLWIPIAIALLYVVTMQQYGEGHSTHSADNGTILTIDDASYWGKPYESVVRVWDAASGKQKAHWSVPLGSFQNLQISPDGSRFLDSMWSGKIYVGRLIDSLAPNTVLYELPENGNTRQVLFGPNSKRLFYEGVSGTPRWMDLASGESNDFVCDWPSNQEYYFWNSPTWLESYSRDERNVRYVQSFRLDDDRLIRVGKPIRDETGWCNAFADGTRAIREVTAKGIWEVLDVRTGERLYTLPAPQGIGRDSWSYCDGKFICLHTFELTGSDLSRVKTGAVFDGETGQLITDLDLDIVCRDTHGIPAKNGFLIATQDNSYQRIDWKGNQSVLVPSLTRWWWPARIIVFACAIAWWLTWSLRQRRAQRSHQPLIDIGVLHATLFMCTGLRLWAYAYGPHWTGYLHVWESVPFLGIGLSIVSWFILWIVFGRQKWPLRFGVLVFGLAVVIGVIVLIWNTASNARGGDGAIAFTQTATGAITQLCVQFGILWMMSLVGLRFVNAADGPALVAQGDSKPRTSLSDLFVWMVSFGILFAILQLRSIAILDRDNLIELLMTGALAGFVGVGTLWLGVGTSLWRFPAVVVIYATIVVYLRTIDRIEIAHVGCSWIPMILISAAVFRWNGYALTWPREQSTSLPEPAVSSGEGWQW